MNPKSAAREYAIQFLFSNQEVFEDKDLLKAALDDFSTSYNEPDREQPNTPLSPEHHNFALTLIEGVLDHQEELLKKIEASLIKNKKLNSINKIDLKILLIAFYEIAYNQETPKGVVINEAINIAKKYSTKDSYVFINGILDKLQ